jgi:hypothetical protein
MKEAELNELERENIVDRIRFSGVAGGKRLLQAFFFLKKFASH